MQATLAELTTRTIVQQVLLCGGCEYLLVLRRRRAQSACHEPPVSHTDKFGVSGDDMEAFAFAWLAFRTLSGLPGNILSVTGAREEMLLGAIYPVMGPSMG